MALAATSGNSVKVDDLPRGGGGRANRSAHSRQSPSHWLARILLPVTF